MGLCVPNAPGKTDRSLLTTDPFQSPIYAGHWVMYRSTGVVGSIIPGSIIKLSI